MYPRKAVFLDRDGTLIHAIERPDFVKKITAPFEFGELEYYKDVHRALGLLQENGYMTIMVTNQPDVAYGYMSESEWLRIHNHVLMTLDPVLDDYYMSREAGDKCPIKKPSPNMLLAACGKYGIDVSRSYMIGDTWKDMEAGRSAKCRRVIMLNRPYNMYDDSDDVRADSLMDAVNFILNDE